jgi:hypothetical protein
MVRPALLLCGLAALGLHLDVAPAPVSSVPLGAAATVDGGSSSSSSCTFYGASATGDCLVWDLSALPNRTWMVNDTTTYRDPYLIGPPCGVATCQSQCGKQACARCTSQHAAGYQMHPGQDRATVCSRCMALGAAPVPSCMQASGLRLATTGGYQGRNLVYELICDPTASATAGPEPGITQLSPPGHAEWSYGVTWRTPLACPKASPSPCPPPSAPTPAKWWTCAAKGQLNRPTLPRWNHTYDMARSTIVMPCNTSGPLDPDFFSQFGIVDVDWSHMKHQWANTKPMDSSGLMVKQAQALRARNPNCRLWVYRNLVKALPWITSVREKLEDPQYSGWFVPYDPSRQSHPNAPPCDLHRTNKTERCSRLYHDQRETPEAFSYCAKTSAPPSCDPTAAGNFVNGKPDPNQYCDQECDCGQVPCGEFLFDHRNESLQKWLVEEYIGGQEGIGNPDISGMYVDDGWSLAGPSEIDNNAVNDTGLSPADLQDMIGAWGANMQAVQQYSIQHGALMWQNFFNSGTCAGPPFKQGNEVQCNAFFRNTACVADSPLQSVPLFYGIERNADYPPFKYIVSFEQSLAAFLLARGPFGWYGYSWISCIGDFGRGGKGMPLLNYTFPDALKVDYGEPLEMCKETGVQTGRYVREWYARIA